MDLDEPADYGKSFKTASFATKTLKPFARFYYMEDEEGGFFRELESPKKEI